MAAATLRARRVPVERTTTSRARRDTSSLREDRRLLLRLLGPRVHAANAGRYRDLGLDERTIATIHATLRATLADGDPRSRSELADAFGVAGLSDATGIRLAHLVMHRRSTAWSSRVPCAGPSPRTSCSRTASAQARHPATR